MENIGPECYGKLLELVPNLNNEHNYVMHHKPLVMCLKMNLALANIDHLDQVEEIGLDKTLDLNRWLCQYNLETTFLSL